MDASSMVLQASHEILVRAASDPTTATRPPVYKAIGITLAICSGLFIGVSFVLKKVGLLKANTKYNEEAGEGYGYLKNAYWWTGMTLMIIGEICNFVAYAFVDAILVTPLGALSVVITTILSAIFLKERLSFVGKVGCFICIIGSVVIVMNAPAQSSAATIQEMQSFVIAPGFLSYAGVVIIACAFIAFWVGPRYGKKSMLVYLTICSLIGGLSVVATQGLGAAVVAQAGGTPQFNQWFLYVLLVFVVCTLLTEIIFLNKALNIFNAAMVTPTYYVYFTSSTIVSSAILFRGFNGSPTAIATLVMGFLQICSGVVLLQLSKSAKDVPDAAVFSGDLDQVRTVAEQEEPESEPKADAIRGTAAIIRRISQSRAKMEAAEAKRVHEDRMKDRMEPIGENEHVEWDGLRRRKTIISGSGGSLHRRKTLHPPLGLTRFPDNDDEDYRPTSGQTDGSARFGGSFLSSFRRPRARSDLAPVQDSDVESPTFDRHPLADHAEDLILPAYKGPNLDVNTHYSNQPEEAMEMSHVYGLPPGLQKQDLDGTTSPRPTSPGSTGVSYHGKPIMWASNVEDHARPQSKDSIGSHQPGSSAKRQFSFSNVFNRHKQDAPSNTSHARRGLGSRQGSKEHSIPGIKTATEEERLGLAKGDSAHMLPISYEQSDSESSTIGHSLTPAASSNTPLPVGRDKEIEGYESNRQRWSRPTSPPDMLLDKPTSKRRPREDDSESDQDLFDVNARRGQEGRRGGGPTGGAFI